MMNNPDDVIGGTYAQETSERLAREAKAEAAILDSFWHHDPSPEQVKRIESLRVAFHDAAKAILRLSPQPSADRTAATRQLHEAMMTAVKSIVLEPPRPFG